mmetsp:Transcript_3443/g.9799  ORF Transcript_3443/g.9799 Transcript_3443/m.9799 type:complete len:203 (-) Transcript_3443:243-851(-)
MLPNGAVPRPDGNLNAILEPLERVVHDTVSIQADNLGTGRVCSEYHLVMVWVVGVGRSLLPCLKLHIAANVCVEVGAAIQICQDCFLALSLAGKDTVREMNREVVAEPPTLIGIAPSRRVICIVVHLGGNVPKNTESLGSIQNLQQNFFRLIEGEFASISACHRVRGLEISSATFLLLSSWVILTATIHILIVDAAAELSSN